MRSLLLYPCWCPVHLLGQSHHWTLGKNGVSHDVYQKWCLSAGKKLEGIISRHTIARSPWIYPWFRETWLGPLSQATTGKRKRTSMIFWVVIRCYKPKLPQIALLNLADLADLADWWVSWRYHSHIRGSIPTTDKLDSDLFPPFQSPPNKSWFKLNSETVHFGYNYHEDGVDSENCCWVYGGYKLLQVLPTPSYIWW